MKWIVIFLVLVTIAAPLTVAVLVDIPTGIFVLAAWSVVCVCGGAPVLFAVVTRRTARRQAELEQAEEIRNNG